MVLAHHLIWTAYGTWLPNDLRGSGSREVISRKLAALGDAHLGRKCEQPRRGAVREFYGDAEPLLVHPVVRFDVPQRAIIARAFALVINEAPYTCWACAVMRDHVHLVVRKHKHLAEAMIDRIQDASRRSLREAGLVPADHPVWADGGWRTFLNSPQAIRQCIGYVERNPEKEGLPRQVWPFVSVYNGWPFHNRRG